MLHETAGHINLVVRACKAAYSLQHDQISTQIKMHVFYQDVIQIEWESTRCKPGPRLQTSV